MTDTQGAEPAREDTPLRTRDWVWGLVVVVGGMLIITAALVWILVGSSSCGTRPAPGYEDAGTATCGSFVDPRHVAGAPPGQSARALPRWIYAPTGARPYRRST